MTLAEVNRAITTASREYIAAKRSGDPDRIATATTQLDALVLRRDDLLAAGG
jgi:hypothetical protein